jgi:acyl-CoA synthetase (AMP-forming)/AMP-acid ligase II
VFDYEGHGLLASGTRPALPGGPQTVRDLLQPGVEAHPDAEALIGRSGRLSWSELDREVDRAAAALADLGVGPYERVAACLPNDVDIVIAFLAAMRIGAIWLGVNRPLAAPEKAYLLRDSGACVFIASSDMLEQVESERAELPELQHLIALDDWRARVAASDGRKRPEVEIDPFAPAAIAYTSGTTGFPKGAVHSQHNLLALGAAARETGLYEPGLRVGVQLPLTILNLFTIQVLVAYQVGGACICIDTPEAAGIAEWIREERVAYISTVPTIYHDLLVHPDVEPKDFASLVVAEMGGADPPVETRRDFAQRFGCEIYVGYGMTEAPSLVTRSTRGGLAPGLIGRPQPHLAIHILDEDGRPVDPGETGEICVGPAQEGPVSGIYTPMLGYWNRPEETQKALRDGLYRSGDLGFLGEDGEYYITGRRNELILRGGANVYPADVQRVFRRDPRVRDAAVMGGRPPIPRSCASSHAPRWHATRCLTGSSSCRTCRATPWARWSSGS